jgi:predicted TIM-barrel fold metal-dependent hydrolase
MRFMDLIDAHEHVYADVGNSRYVYDTEYRGHYTTLLGVLLGSGPTLDDVHRKRRRRLMFGSDYWMNTMNPVHEGFLTAFSDGMQALVGTEAKSWFMGANALRWLGITGDSDEPLIGNRNRQRLVAFYDSKARPDWLADG